MKKTNKKQPTENKVKIPGAGTFNIDAMKGTKKGDLAQHFEHLPENEAKSAQDKIWLALKGEDVWEDLEETS